MAGERRCRGRVGPGEGRGRGREQTQKELEEKGKGNEMQPIYAKMEVGMTSEEGRERGMDE